MRRTYHMTHNGAGPRQRRISDVEGKPLRGLGMAAIGVAVVSVGLTGCSSNEPSSSSSSASPTSSSNSASASPDVPVVDGLSHVTIKTNDLTATVAFYTGVIAAPRRRQASLLPAIHPLDC